MLSGLNNGFQRIVPNEILTLRLGARPKNDESNFTSPTLVVHYVIKPSGELYTLSGTTDGFVGITVLFDLVMHVPGAKPWPLQFSVEPPKTFSVNTPENRWKTQRSQTASPSAKTVYATMANTAFGRVAQELFATFFETEAVKQPTASALR